MRAVHVLALVVPVLASGCWFFAPTGLDGVAEAQIRASCHFAFACCTAEERFEFSLRASSKDEGSCVQENLEEGSGTFNLVDRAKAVVNAGKGTYNQERADECLKPLLDALNNCDAEAVFAASRDPECEAEQQRGFVEGNVDDGDDCSDSIECVDFGLCRPDPDADPNTITTAGKCVVPAKEGEKCFDASTSEVTPCSPGTQCDFSGPEPVCKESELLADGEECFDDVECKGGFCTTESVQSCSFGGEPCAVDTDCPNNAVGETCERDEREVCSSDGPKVEICDGL